MKKVFLLSVVCLSVLHAWALTSITTGTITGSPFCGGATVNVPYTVNGPANPGNVFTAQLSNSSGSFASPVNIGTLNATGSGTITATIPLGTGSGTKYRIRVVSSNPVVIGSTNTKNLKINPKPGGTTVTAITACAATLNWNATATASSYKTRFKKSSDPKSAYSSPVNVGNVVHYTFTSLKPNTSYDFQVRAVCANGEVSDWKLESASTAALPVPTGGVETGMTPVSITYDWNDATCATGYRVRTRITGDPTWEKYSTFTSSGGTVTGLFPATDYEAQIATLAGTDSGAYSATIFGNTTYRMASSANATASVNVFPNPSDGTFTLQLDGLADNAALEITIQNVYGQTIYSSNKTYHQGLNEENISIPNAVSGMYLVRVKANDEMFDATLMVK